MYLAVRARVNGWHSCKLPDVPREILIFDHYDVINSQVSPRVCPLLPLLKIKEENSFLQRVQNSFAKCVTRLQRYLQYTSAGWKVPGGARMTFVFIVRRWLGVSGLSESGSASWLTVKGRPLTIASASHIRFLRDSASNCFPFFCNRDERTFRVDLISRSQTPPMLLAAGTFILNETQSHCSSNSLVLIFSWSILAKAWASSVRAPTKLAPWSLLSWRKGPRRQINLLKALMKASVLRELAVAMCTALEAMQVKSMP